MHQGISHTANPVLEDALQPGLKLVFCGTAASRRSAQEQAYYAHPGNQFWRALYATGMTSRLYQPQEYRQLLARGIGFTDLAKHHAGTDSELPDGAFDRDGLYQRLLHYRPHTIAFTSKTGAQHALGRAVAYGLQPCMFAQSHVFVLPSPSGQARRYWDIRIWQALADHFARCR